MNIYNFEKILSLSKEPEKKDEFNKWVQQEDVIPFLAQEIEDDYIIIYASLPHVYVHSILIPEVSIDESTIKDLSQWNHDPYSAWSYVMSSSIWIEGPLHERKSKIISKGMPIFFARSFDGYKGKERYYELNQIIAQVLEIHYLPERQAWCRLNRFGDLEDIIQIKEINGLPNNETGIVILANRNALEEFSSVNDQFLLRTFDITRFKTSSFNGWGNNKEVPFSNEKDVFGTIAISNGYGSYFRGVQIRAIGIPKTLIRDRHWGALDPEEEKRYATFIVQDWKNDKITEVSCAPSSSSSYFEKSDLPFQISPVFFRPEVLLKYKSDTEKYQFLFDSIICRGGWELKTFDINGAGQVHTYLGYLGHLPYEEQLHWKQYNESPKAPISERAFKADFQGQWSNQYDPLMGIKNKLEELQRINIGWWTLRSENLIQKCQYPFTNSVDEWAGEILNLDQLIVEGLEKKWLKKKAKELKRDPDDRFRELKLLEECLVGLEFDEDHAYQILSPLHIVHNLRSKLKGHASGSDAVKIKKEALTNYGSYRKHFEHLCTECDESLEIIIKALP